MVATVETLGGTAPRALYAAYEQFNREHFDEKLGAPLILIGACSSPRALGDYIGQDVHGLESRIRIAERAVSGGIDYATWVLLHEMIHAWCNEQMGDPERGYRGHGPKFAAKCNEIGARFGFAPVGVKGRKGLPDCAHWPFNVMSRDAEGDDDGGGSERDDDGAERDKARAAACLHCGAKAAKTPAAAPRFCGTKCAWTWIEAQTAPLAWCDAHGWRAGDCTECA